MSFVNIDMSLYYLRGEHLYGYNYSWGISMVWHCQQHGYNGQRLNQVWLVIEVLHLALPAAGMIILKIFHLCSIVALGIASIMMMFVAFGLASGSGGNSKNSNFLECLRSVAMCRSKH